MFLRRFRHLFRSKDKDELRLPFVCTVWYTVKIDTLTNEIKAFRNSTFMTTIYFTEIQEGRDQIIISRNALLPIYPAWSAFNTYYNLVKRYCEGFFFNFDAVTFAIPPISNISWNNISIHHRCIQIKMGHLVVAYYCGIQM